MEGASIEPITSGRETQQAREAYAPPEPSQAPEPETLTPQDEVSLTPEAQAPEEPEPNNPLVEAWNSGTQWASDYGQKLLENPLTAPFEETGALLQATGNGIRQGGQWVADNVPLRPADRGVVVGLSEGAGDLVSGTGALLETGAKLYRGDEQTLEEGASLATGAVQAGAYVAGQYLENDGRRAENWGMTGLGQASQGLGQQLQSLASPQVAAGIDTLEAAGANAGAQIERGLGSGLEALGVENGLQEQAQPILEATADNPIVQAASARLDEYRNDPEFAIARDLSRGAFEVGTLLVGPETVLGRAGEVGRGVEVARLTSKARGAEDALLAARKIPEPPLGAWDPKRPPNLPGEPVRARAAEDPIMRAKVDEVNDMVRQRQAERDLFARGDTEDPPQALSDTLKEARAAYRESTMPDRLSFDSGESIDVYGARSHEELERLRNQVASMDEAFPGTARATNEIFLLDELGRAGRGQFTGVSDSALGLPNFGIANPNATSIIKRGQEHTVYHELFHNLDAREGNLFNRFWSGQGAFGQGETVSRYATTNAMEDAAETATQFMQNEWKLAVDAMSGDGSLQAKYQRLLELQERLRQR